MHTYLITFFKEDSEHSIYVSVSSYDDLMNLINFHNILDENSFILSILEVK